jgi:hypothetical protein
MKDRILSFETSTRALTPEELDQVGGGEFFDSFGLGTGPSPDSMSGTPSAGDDCTSDMA